MAYAKWRECWLWYLNHGLGTSSQGRIQGLTQVQGLQEPRYHPLGVPNGKSSYFQVGSSTGSRHRTPRSDITRNQSDNGHSNGKGLDVRTREKGERAKENGNDSNIVDEVIACIT